MSDSELKFKTQAPYANLYDAGSRAMISILKEVSAQRPLLTSSVMANASRPNRLFAEFPWMLFLFTWLTDFAIQHRMDAPAISLDGGGTISDFADSVRSGNIQRQIVIAIIGAIGVLLLLRGRSRLQFNGALFGLLFAYVGWIALSLTWADDPTITLRRQIAFALTLIFSAGCVTRLNIDSISTIVMGMTTLNLIPGIAVELWYGNLHPFATGNRFGGTVHPNHQAADLSLAIIILCWWIWRMRGRIRVILGCVCGLLLCFMVMTGSRTSAVALFAAVGFSGAMALARDHRSGLLRLVGLAVLSAGTVSLAGLTFLTTGQRSELVNTIRMDRDDGDVTELTGRVEVWRTCLEFAAERPFRGYGFQGFWSDKHIKTISEEVNWPVMQGHSAYLDELLALGIIGLVIYTLLLLACLLSCVGRFLRGDDRYGAWAAVVFFFVVHNVSESISVQLTFPGFVFSLILVHLALVRPTRGCGIQTLVLRRKFVYGYQPS